MSVSSASWIISSTGCTPRAAAASATGRVGGNGEENTCIRSNSGGRRFAAERLGVRTLVGDLHRAVRRRRGPRAGAVARRSGSARSSRHSGRRSKGSCVRNDEKAPMPRGWVTPHIRARLAIGVVQERERLVVHRPWSRRDAGREREVGEHPRRASPSGDRAVGDHLEDAGAELAEDVDQRAHLVPRRDPGRDRACRRRSGGAPCATS